MPINPRAAPCSATPAAWRCFTLGVLVLVAALLAWQKAQTAEPTVITLSCDGTVRDNRASDGKREPINNLGLVANLAELTVSFSSYVLHIDSVSAANISFSGETTTQFGGHPITVVGDIDRVTGAMTATTESPIWTDTYDVLCKPVRPSF
jgi:hypothetical protein